MRIFPIIVLICSIYTTNAQDRLYPNTFSLSEVRLLEGSFKHARDLNIQTLLQYDVDRLVNYWICNSGCNAAGQNPCKGEISGTATEYSRGGLLHPIVEQKVAAGHVFDRHSD